MTERWLPVPGWDGVYEVSDLGRVRSLPRRVPSRHEWHPTARAVPGRILRASPRGEYLRVTLARDGRRYSVNVHRLVLEAFRGPAPTGMETLHGNGDGTDNRLGNLRWGTGVENQEDRRRHGRTVGPVPRDTCRNGHEYAVTGTITRRDGRRCRACQIGWRRAHRTAAG